MTDSVPLRHYSDEASDEMQCRICLETENVDEMIKPCFCSGSSANVHRACLDQWRATKRGDVFTHCGTCHFQYIVDVEQNEEANRTRKNRFRLFVARDSISVFVCLQLAIALLGACVWWYDSRNGGIVQDAFPEWLGKHTKTTYYVCGLVLFLCIMGIAATLTGCVVYCSGNHGAYTGPDFCYCGTCNCGDCRGDCDGDCGKACAGLLIVAVIILIVVGAVFVVFLGTMVVQKIVQRHYRYLWLREEATKYIVRDLRNVELGVSTHEVAIHVEPSAPPAMPNIVHAPFYEPSAPPSYPKELFDV